MSELTEEQYFLDIWNKCWNTESQFKDCRGCQVPIGICQSWIDKKEEELKNDPKLHKKDLEAIYLGIWRSCGEAGKRECKDCPVPTEKCEEWGQEMDDAFVKFALKGVSLE